MLNPFPDLLMLGFLAPTILRVAAGGVLLVGAYTHFKSRRGSTSTILALGHLLIGLMLLFGFYTQIASLVGIVGILASFVLPSRVLKVDPLPASTVILLLAIFASLMLSGAGAFAFDIPL